MKFAIGTATLVVLLPALVFAADLSGRWTAPFNREGTPVTIVMNIKVSDGQVTGTMTHASGKEMQIQNGKLDGNKLSFETTLDAIGRKFTFAFEGDAGDDIIKLHRLPGNGEGAGPNMTFHRSEK